MRLHEGDPQRVATILPGQGYTPDMPLLHFARQVLTSGRWTVREVWWDEVPNADSLSVSDVVRHVLKEDEDVGTRLLVAKSLGTLALPIAADTGTPGIWLTPLLFRPEVARAAQALSAPSLLVGGTADQSWADGYRGNCPDVRVMEIDGADHGLELPGNAPGSARVLADVAEAMQEFVDSLPEPERGTS